MNYMKNPTREWKVSFAHKRNEYFDRKRLEAQVDERFIDANLVTERVHKSQDFKDFKIVKRLREKQLRRSRYFSECTSSRSHMTALSSNMVPNTSTTGNTSSHSYAFGSNSPQESPSNTGSPGVVSIPSTDVHRTPTTGQQMSTFISNTATGDSSSFGTSSHALADFSMF